jgi:bis(5'-nucleosyl)-tetraphosphatase (symmetrical)
MPPTGGPRRLFLGDVHACADELEEMLERLAPGPDDELAFVGDLASRGPHPLRALRLVRDVAQHVVLGNHDLHLLGVAAGEREASPGDGCAEILDAPDAAELLDWLRTRPLVVEWGDAWMVHAGIHPAWTAPRDVAAPLEERIAAGRIPWGDDALSFLTRARECDAHGRRPGDGAAPEDLRPWDAWYRGSRTLVFGHWAARGRVEEGRVRGLDTGCLWGGALTAWIAEEDRFVSVAARRTYREPDGPPGGTSWFSGQST